MTPLELAWETYGGTLLGDHGKVKAKCPLHDDSHASARVNIETQRWICYAGCGRGDIYELIKLAEVPSGSLTFPEQRRIAMERFGTDRIGPTATVKQKPKKPWKKPWLK